MSHSAEALMVWIEWQTEEKIEQDPRQEDQNYYADADGDGAAMGEALPDVAETLEDLLKRCCWRVRTESLSGRGEGNLPESCGAARPGDASQWLWSCD